MAATEPPARRTPALITIVNWALTIVTIIVFALMAYLMWPFVVTRFQAQLRGQPLGAATSAPVPPLAPIIRQPDRQLAPADLQSAPAAPLPGIAQNEATSTAMYQATAAAANAASAPLQNVDALPADAPPVQLGSRPADRQPAGANVPTAEPITQDERGGIFGSKPVLVNPQETHECRHGQQWVEGRGCKNLTPIGAQP